MLAETLKAAGGLAEASDAGPTREPIRCHGDQCGSIDGGSAMHSRSVPASRRAVGTVVFSVGTSIGGLWEALPWSWRS